MRSTGKAMKDLTLGIKTFDRPECLRSLLQSVRHFYPELPVLVADDGRQSSEGLCEEFGARCIRMDFDSGLSAGRNRLADEADTKFIAIAEDDFVFTTATKLERFCSEMGDYDLLGGSLVKPNGTLQRYEGLMEQVGTELRLYRPNPRRTCPMHIVLNWMVAQVEVLRELRWYEPLKMIEHEDFFWRCRLAGVRVGYCPSVSCIHDSKHPVGYAAFRNRSAQFWDIVKRRWGWERVVWTVAQ